MPTEIIGNIKGDIGATPNITIGTVTTLPTGQAAFASITGTAENPVLNLGLPKGATGSKGLTGDVNEAQLNQAIAMSEAKVRPVSAGGTGSNVSRTEISSNFTPYTNIVTTGDDKYSVTAYFYPYEKICRFRLYCVTNFTFQANTEYVLGELIPYKPNAIHIMSSRAFYPINYVDIETDGKIKIKTGADALPTGYAIFVTGWWFYNP